LPDVPLTEARPAAEPEPWAAPPRRRRWSAGTRHRLWALVALVVIGGPAFLIGGKYWVGHLDLEEAVARFRAAGPHAAEDAGPGLPRPGVYRYRTTGGEDISFLDYRRDYSRTTMRIVTRRGCGVREEQWFLVQHVEYYDRCGDALPSYGTDIAYWWTHGTQDFTCAPGGSFDMSRGYRPGDRVTWSCRDEDTRAEQITEYVADEEVVVAGTAVPARHIRWTTHFSGATRGTATVDDWFHPATGLVLREKRVIGLRVGSPFVGQLGYTDNSDFTLVSLTPAR
jgi:hypothetical protein